MDCKLKPCATVWIIYGENPSGQTQSPWKNVYSMESICNYLVIAQGGVKISGHSIDFLTKSQ